MDTEELIIARLRLLEHLEANGFESPVAFGSVDIEQHLHGLEVTGIHSREHANEIAMLMTKLFPKWKQLQIYFEEQNRGEIGWKVILSKKPFSKTTLERNGWVAAITIVTALCGNLAACGGTMIARNANYSWPLSIVAQIIALAAFVALQLTSLFVAFWITKKQRVAFLPSGRECLFALSVASILSIDFWIIGISIATLSRPVTVATVSICGCAATLFFLGTFCSWIGTSGSAIKRRLVVLGSLLILMAAFPLAMFLWENRHKTTNNPMHPSSRTGSVSREASVRELGDR